MVVRVAPIRGRMSGRISDAELSGEYGYRLGLFIVFDVEMRKINKVKCLECGWEVELPPDVLDKLEALGHGK